MNEAPWSAVKKALVLAAAVALGWPSVAAAQGDPTIIPVPYAQNNPNLPHPAHEGARITLKAIARNSACAAGYRVWWDTNFNGNYDDDTFRDVAAQSGTIYDLGRTFEVPVVPRDTLLPVNVRLRNNCNNQFGFGTFKIFVYDFTLSPDPVNWTNDQIQIVSAMVIQESMWWIHRIIGNRAGFNTAETRAHIGGETTVDGLGLWVFTANGHLPAYPPGTVVPANIGAPVNFVAADWTARNNTIWNTDPYAEDIIGMVNYVLLAGTGTTGNNFNCADDRFATTKGYNGEGQEIPFTRIAGTDNCLGAYTGGYGNNTYAQGMLLGGLATTLPTLARTNLQVGGMAGVKWEFFIQEMTDFLGYMQVDGGVARGAWYYSAFDGDGNGNNSDLSTSQWAYVGLESAEVAGGAFGVFVSNRHKYRMADNMIANQERGVNDGGGAYDTTRGPSNYQLTGGSLLGARMMNTHNFEANDNTVAFPGQSRLTRGRLRQSYDRYMGYISSGWTRSAGEGSVGWTDRLWERGDYLCGNRNAVYNAGRCGNTYGMYSHQKAYRTGTLEIVTIPNAVAGQPAHDWFRQFSIYYARAQDRSLNDYGNFGRLTDDFCGPISVTCAFNAPFMSSAMAGLTVTQAVFKPKPVALPNVAPPAVTEGCFGGNNGQVRFTHNESFHPNPSARIVAYQWDVDASNGLWWNTGALPDFNVADAATPFDYRYARRRAAPNENQPYTATLRVVDNNPAPDPALTNEKTVTVTVGAAPAERPSAAHGGAYIIEVNDALQLAGTATDPNLACGDVLTTAWRLNDANGPFNFANGATALVPWANLQNLPRGQAIPLFMRVTDAGGRVSDPAQTTLTIYERNPIASAVANPNPAACNQDVTFDASLSDTPNPNREISFYEWSVDGVPGYEIPRSNNPVYTHRYNQFGTYEVRLRVTDDLGRTSELNPFLTVNVNQGNVRPNARVAQGNYVVLEGSTVQLDGRGSDEPNVGCGDSIVAYEWDINNNGRFNDPVDVQGAQPIVPWATLNTLAWPADRDLGLPTNTVTLRVRDEFGLEATATTTITIYRATPEAIVTQLPDPSPVNTNNGDSSTRLIGGESRSPIPGVNIARFDWDLNDDGNFETLDAPETIFNYDFAPAAGQRPPANLPPVFVRLRVTDSSPERRTATARVQVRFKVPPTTPTADADPTPAPEAEYHILLGDPVALDPSASFDPDAAEFGDFIRFYRWEMNYRGPIDAANIAWDFTTEDPNGARANIIQNVTAQQLAGLGINAAGVFPVLLEVEEDFAQLTNRDTTTLHVYNRNPVALASANPNPAACGARVTFDGARSDHPHPEIEVVNWEWDTDGDGQYDDQVGETVQQVYNQFAFAGPIRVGLRVTDNRGAVGTTTVDLNVNAGNRDPVANAGGTYTIVVGDNLALTGAGSSEPDVACGDAIARYEWDLNADGSYEFNTVNPAQPVTWAQLNAAGINAARPLNNPYTVRLRVTDRFGRQTTNNAVLNVVALPTASAFANPDSIACNQQVVFDGSASVSNAPAGDANLALARWEWDFNGDNVYETQGARVTRNVASLVSPYVARFRVVDAAGHTSAPVNVSVRITLVNVAPTADAGGPYVTGRANGNFAPITLDGRGSRDPNEPCDAISLYKWDTDGDLLYGADDNAVVGGPNGGTDDFTGATVPGFRDARWQVNQQFVVRLIVCDTFNVCGNADDATISVQEEAPPQGEIVSPRANDPSLCISSNPFDVAYTVSDPEGEAVTVIALMNNMEVARQVNVATNANGTPVAGTIRINPAMVPEGQRTLELRFDDGRGGVTTVNAGGSVLVDRTAPTVTIGNNIPENVCLPENQVANIALQVQTMDAGDPAPRVTQTLAEAGCRNAYTVTATDRCGNAGSAVRNVRVAEPVEVTINGATEGQLVASARLTWMVVGPADCAGNITAQLDGANYAQNTLVNQAGPHVLDLTIPNCAGVARHQLLNFVVNTPPVPDAITMGHPNADPNGPANRPSYIVDEGTALQVDASETRAPEQIDRVVRFQWDFTNDGVIDLDNDGRAQGAAPPSSTAAFPTTANGVFTGKLIVTDSLGATAEQLFQVTVRDITPIANAGGPYVVPQGVRLTLDGTRSRSLSPADAIVRYTWNFADGTADGVVAAPNPNSIEHTWLNDGLYNVRLTVTDEDNSADVVTTVEVRDVDPIIDTITPPDPAYEIADMVFSIDATEGAPGDPITRIEWDFTGDGRPDAAGDTVSWIFEDAGTYPVTVTVFDRDSETTQSIDLAVREITFAELMEVARDRVNAVLNDPNAPIRARGKLASTNEAIDDGLWAERYGRRGDSWVAWEYITRDITQSQGAGGDFGNLLWAISRTLLRDLTALRADVVTGTPDRDPVPEDHPSVVEADAHLAYVREYYDDPDFRQDVTNDAPQLVRRVYGEGYEGYFYLRDAIDPCNAYGKFAVPPPVGPNRDPVRRVQNANSVNADLITALGELRTELLTYVNSGAPNDFGPARAEVLELLDTLARIQDLTRLPIAIECEPGACINDTQALENELLLMDLIDQLLDANGEGMYIRNIQSCLMLAVKFRIEISLLRVEFLCGEFSPTARAARLSQRLGLELVDSNDITGALDYYTADDQRCLIVRTFNTCFVAREPGLVEQPWPAVCPEFEQQQ